MNVIKFSPFILGHLKRNINVDLEKNVRYYGSSKKLINIDANAKTGIYTVKFNRPPVNSLSLEVINEFINAMMNIEKDKAKGMIVTSTSPGIFTAGLDLMELYKPNQDRLRAYWSALQDMWLKLYGSGYCTAAAISGHAPGGGCLVSISCDYRVMVQGPFGIGLNETQLGLVAPSCFSPDLLNPLALTRNGVKEFEITAEYSFSRFIDTFKNTLSPREAEMALISGKLFSVDEALSVKLIDDVAADNDEAISKAEKYLVKLGNLSQTGLGQTKLTIRYDAISRLQDNRENDLRVFINFINSADTQKALDAYVQNLKKK